mgnify:FL=1
MGNYHITSTSCTSWRDSYFNEIVFLCQCFDWPAYKLMGIYHILFYIIYLMKGYILWSNDFLMLMFALAGYRTMVCTVARYYSTTIPPMHRQRKSHIISLLHNLYSFIAYKLNSLNHVVLFLDTNEFRRNQIPYSKVATPLYVYTILQFLTLFFSPDPNLMILQGSWWWNWCHIVHVENHLS